MIENYLRCFCDHNQRNWAEILNAAEFSYNSAEIENMNICPFELHLGWKPKSPIEFLLLPEYSVEAVSDLRPRLSAAGQDPKLAQLLAQSRKSVYNQKRYRPPTHKVGDNVWIRPKYFTDALLKVKSSRKLGVQGYGPFRVLELLGKRVVRLDLPPKITVHPVVHVEHTSRVSSQPADITQAKQPCPSPIPQPDVSSLIYVDKIIGHIKRGKGYQLIAAKTCAPLQESERKPRRDVVDQDDY